MLSKLNKPFPCIYGQKQNLITAVLISVFVAMFLTIFQPFGISENEDPSSSLKTAGFGLVSFVVLMFFYFIVPKLMAKYFIERNYTLGRDIIMSTCLILSIGLFNGLYSHFVLSEPGLKHPLIMLWQTFLVGIFPLTFLSLMQYNRMLKLNVKASDDINSFRLEQNTTAHNDTFKQYFQISGDQKLDEVSYDELIYIESDGNYAYLIADDGGDTKRTMYRTTLKSLDNDNQIPSIIRCHRSFIVNLEKVTDIKGNAQGLKLSLDNCSDIIPVSRKYIPEVRAYFSK